MARKRDVVEPDDRHVVRHPATRTLEPVDLLDRDGVVMCDDSGRLVAELDPAESAPLDGLRERTLAALAAGLAERAACECEPGVTEALQMRDERVERTLLVHVDDADLRAGVGAEASEEHGDAALGDVLGRARPGAQTGHEDGVDATVEQRRDLRALRLRIAAGVGDQETEALVAGASLGAERELRVERVPLVGHDGADHPGRALAQRPRDPVRPVAEVADRILDALARRCADDIGAPHDVRHRRLRDARVSRDVADRGRISHATSPAGTPRSTSGHRRVPRSRRTRPARPR